MIDQDDMDNMMSYAAEQATGCPGAGDYFKWAREQGYPYLEVLNWTSSAGDWQFIVSKDQKEWQVMFQENNYPEPGFNRTIDKCVWVGTKEQVFRMIEDCDGPGYIGAIRVEWVEDSEFGPGPVITSGQTDHDEEIRRMADEYLTLRLAEELDDVSCSLSTIQLREKDICHLEELMGYDTTLALEVAIEYILGRTQFYASGAPYEHGRNNESISSRHV